MPSKLLVEFQRLFHGKRYRHRVSNLGDFVAMHLYEDLYDLQRSTTYVSHVDTGVSVLSVQNQQQGISTRRSDGTFGEVVPGTELVRVEDYAVARGPIAILEIGAEFKILMKAMRKQIGRVKVDLSAQASAMRATSEQSIRTGFVGINYAPQTTTYEGSRAFPTTGGQDAHPIDEAAGTEVRLRGIAGEFEEFLLLRFDATNVPPYEFNWVDFATTEQDYRAALTRISQRYQTRYERRV